MPPPADEPGTAKPDDTSNSVCLLWRTMSPDAPPLPARWAIGEEEKADAEPVSDQAPHGRWHEKNQKRRKKKRESTIAELASVFGEAPEEFRFGQLRIWSG